jgi:hypothetical protein
MTIPSEFLKFLQPIGTEIQKGRRTKLRKSRAIKQAPRVEKEREGSEKNWGK